MAFPERSAVLLLLAVSACQTISDPCEPVSFFFDGTLAIDGAEGAGQFQGGSSPLSIGAPAFAAMDSSLFTDTPGAAAIRLAGHTLLGEDRSGVLTLALAAPLSAGRAYAVAGLTREIETAPHILHTGREAEAGLTRFGVTTDAVEGSIYVVGRDPLALSFGVTFHFVDSMPMRIGGNLRVIRRAGPLRCD